MTSSPFTFFTCPLDGRTLTRSGGSWRCESGHSYDIAREGYVNLLPVQKKKSRDPGDSKEMVAARRRFLQEGHYQPIAAATARAVLADIPPGSTVALLDAGCGEGYYLRELAALAEGLTLELVGLDISKWAVQAAARQSVEMSWVVGSNAGLPLPDNSIDRIMCMFGFPVYTEFARVLKPGGRLILVEAGPDHLRELREVIYPTLKPRPSQRPAVQGFVARETVTSQGSMALQSQQQIADLLSMTPHLYRADSDGRARAAALTALTTTIDVRIISHDLAP